MSKTFRGQHKITVKEFHDGKVYLAFEHLDGDQIPCLSNFNVGLSLDDATSIEEAKNIANIINSKLKGLMFTEL